MIPATLKDIRFRPGVEPVTIIVSTPFGDKRLQTSQATLTGRAGGGNWGDAEAGAVAQDVLDALYPHAGFVVEWAT